MIKNNSPETNLVAARLRKFERLSIGWRLGDGVPTKANVSKFVLDLYSGLTFQSNVFPMINGGIEYRIRGHKCKLELFISPDETFDYIMLNEKNSVIDDDEGLGWVHATAIIKRLHKEERTSSASAHLRSLTKQTGDFSLHPSIRPATGQECQVYNCHNIPP